jgi:predicted RNase H-like HicB family nuclease
MANPRQTEITDFRVMELTAVLTPAEEGGYVAFNPETGTSTEGESIEEALANLREANKFYLEEFPAVVKGHPLVTIFSVPAHAQAPAPLVMRSGS